MSSKGIKPDNSDIVTIPLDSYFGLGSSQYIKAQKRIEAMNHPDRSGDIVLVMKDLGIGNSSERYTTAYACKSWHGSLNPNDSYVPFILSYPGGNKTEVDSLTQTVCPNGQCEWNWSLKDIVRTIINSQFVVQKEN